MKEKFKKRIIDIVFNKQGMKTTELVCSFIDDDFIKEFGKDSLKELDIVSLVNELVDEKKIISIDYALPNIPYRTKSFLLPAGTEIIKE